MAEQVDARDLKSLGTQSRAGSIPALGTIFLRGIAQSGSASALGAGCRGFKSLYPDHFVIIFSGFFAKIVYKTTLVENQK